MDTWADCNSALTSAVLQQDVGQIDGSRCLLQCKSLILGGPYSTDVVISYSRRQEIGPAVGQLYHFLHAALGTSSPEPASG